MPYPRSSDGRAWGPPGMADGPFGPPWMRGGRDPARSRRLRAVALTVPAAVLAVLVTAGSSVADRLSTQSRPLDALGHLLLLVAPACLAIVGLGRRAAAVAGVVAALGVGAYLLLGYAVGPVLAPLLVVVVVLGGGGRRAVSWTVAGLGMTAVVARGLTGPEVRPTSVVLWATALLVAGVLGEAARGRGERVRAVQAAHASQAAAAATAERLRIARELHDVIAHSLSAISVQAGVGLHLMDGEPERAREALRHIRSTSVEALDEVREVLGVLRAEGEAPPRAPATTALADAVPRLLDASRAAGLTVEEDIDGAVLADLGPDRAAVLVRVLQEALTNVRRHAGEGARVAVRITQDASATALEVADDGGEGDPSTRDGGAAPDRAERGAGGTGLGLRGMRERVEALGGAVDAGPRGAGWAVVVELPRGTT